MLDITLEKLKTLFILYELTLKKNIINYNEKLYYYSPVFVFKIHFLETFSYIINIFSLLVIFVLTKWSFFLFLKISEHFILSK